MLLYYITDRRQFPGSEESRRKRLLDRISQASLAHVDYVQLREKDLTARELESLAREATELLRKPGNNTRLLINSRSDVALAVGAAGVHLTSTDISPEDVRRIWRSAHGPGKPIIAVSCHSGAEVIQAERAGADFVVFGPVFKKKDSRESTRGIAGLREASRVRIPVLALGGVTLSNARDCIAAEAAGVAGIRVFQEGDLKKTVGGLRTIS